MCDNMDQLEKAKKLAEEIWRLTRSTLLVHMRFLDSALFRLELKCGETSSIQTNGKYLWYDLKWILNQYRRSRENVTKAYLHIILHCIYRHMFIGSDMNSEMWDIACDIVVENNIRDLDIQCLYSIADPQQTAELEAFREQVVPFTAEKLYRFLCDAKPSQSRINMLQKLFTMDDHSIWYDSSEGSGGNGRDPEEDNFPPSPSNEDMRQVWEKIGHRIQTDLETKSQGKISGSMIQELRAVNREKYDYSEFLQRFMTMGEVMRTNDEEFDYIFYTYGLSLYKNLPLIEPLEYKEVKMIKEFVIAIDTSGSTSGEVVQRFLNKTYNIVKQQENFFTKINLHMIQCDSNIQEDAKITCQEDFEKYLRNMKIRGLGGTDFRPVFSYVDTLRNEGEFTNLKGMIYFTDGWGEFPKHQPEYSTAFVFVDDNYNNYEVPVWAIKLILQSEEI